MSIPGMTLSQTAVKNIMGQANNRGHGNHIPADQAQLHTRLTLGNPVTHGWYPAGKLGCADGLNGIVHDCSP